MSSSQCFENPPSIVSSACGAGTVEEIGGLKTYFSGTHDSSRAILLIADALGYETPNLSVHFSNRMSCRFILQFLEPL
ncbi:unnamed protein product, partial [Thlaspi arvense]